ncbi:hypothetical protein [Streptomyces sp. bgisy084]|uniref:hypothetical protein n=1 Tax=unclassified Streptomyces TaxID=2593676 RepID=UPI003D71F193
MSRYAFLALPSAVADAPKAAVELLAALAAADFAPAGADAVAAATAVAAAAVPAAAATDGARS